jgi:hypothetical protein
MSTKLISLLVFICIEAVLSLTVFCAVVLFGPGVHAPGSGHGNGGAHLVSLSEAVVIGGNAAGPVSPDLMAPFDLSFTNPNAVQISITDVVVTVMAVRAPHADVAHPCVVGDFTVSQAEKGFEITVAAKTAKTLSGLNLPRAQWPQVGLLKRPVNQDGCKGASLTLGYSASGTLKS